MSTARIIVIGAGAIGCFVGGKLAAVGIDVTLVGRARTAAACATAGWNCGWPAAQRKQFARSPLPRLCERHFSANVKDRAPPPDPEKLLPCPPLLTWPSSPSRAMTRRPRSTNLTGRRPWEAPRCRRSSVCKTASATRRPSPRVWDRILPLPGQSPRRSRCLSRVPVQVTKPGFAVGLAPWMAASSASAGRDDGDSASYRPGFTARHQADTSPPPAFPPRIYADAPGMKWSKLIMNMIGNATSAILAQNRPA